MWGQHNNSINPTLNLESAEKGYGWDMDGTRFLYSQLNGIIVALIQIIILKLLIFYDNDLNETVKKLQKIDIACILVQAVASESWIAILTPMNKDNNWLWVQIHMFIVLFIVQSFVDNKIKQIYDILTLQVICFQAITCIDQYLHNLNENGDGGISLYNIAPIAVILGILGVITVFKGLGAGDFLIYVALAIHYLTFQVEPWFLFIISILIGQSLFMVYTAIEALINKKNIKVNKPFTMFLQIAAVICFG